MTVRVGFRASVPVAMTRRPMQADKLWGDQPAPPPPLVDYYNDPENPWRTWPPSRYGEKQTPQQRRISAAMFMLDPKAVQVDETRSKFTYRRCALAGVVELDEERSLRWTANGWSQLDAVTATPVVLLLLRCALRNVYEVPHPEYGSLSDIPLPGLALSLRELSR